MDNVKDSQLQSDQISSNDEPPKGMIEEVETIVEYQCVVCNKIRDVIELFRGNSVCTHDYGNDCRNKIADEISLIDYERGQG